MSRKTEETALEKSLKAEIEKLREENTELKRKLKSEMQLNDQLGKSFDD